MSDLALFVGGKKYGGWKRVRVTRSIESMAGSFELEASDRWAEQDVPWPIAEEDACRVEIDGAMVIDGFVDHRSQSLSATARTLSYSGRDRAAALVDNSTLLDKWTFRGATVADIAKKVAAPFGIAVSVQAGLVLPKAQKKQVVNPGETAHEVIHHAATAAGVLVVSDGAGGILITRAGAVRAAALRQGDNVLAASVDYNATERFHRYVITTQVSRAEWLDGVDAGDEVTRIRAQAIDAGVRRAERILVLRPEKGVTTDYAKMRADWEARVRAAKAESVSVTVQGWKQPRAGLWPLNALVTADVPSIGIKGTLLISQVEHELGEGGELTHLKLVRPDAFTPEPRAVVKPSGAWKELAGGAK